MRRLPVLAIALVAALWCTAQQDSLLIDEIEVTARSSNENELNVQTWFYGDRFNYDEALRDHGFAFIRSYGSGGYTTVAMDGMNAQHTSVFWHGMPVNGAMSGIADLSIYPSGVGSTLSTADIGILQSSSQIGGIVWLDSRRMDEDRLVVRGHQGSFGKWAASVHSNIFLDSNEVNVSIDLGYERAINNYAFVDYGSNPANEGELRHASYDQIYLSPVVEWRPSVRNHVKLSALWALSNRRIPPSVVSPNNLGTLKENGIRLSARWNQIGDRWSVHHTAGYTNDAQAYTESTSSLSIIDTTYNSHRIRLHEQFSYGWRSHTFGISGELLAEWTGARDDVPLLMKGALAANLAIVLVDEWLELDAGARLDLHSQLRNVPSTRLTLKGKLSRNQILRFSVTAARNVRFPTLNDLYFVPSGNSKLNEEAAWKINGGVSLNYDIGPGKKWTVSQELQAYWSRVEDMILWVPTNKQYWSPLNIDRVRASGMQASSVLSFDGQASKMICSIGSYYQFGETVNLRDLSNPSNLFPNDLSTGKQLVYVPKHQLKLNALAGYFGFFTLWNIHYTSRRYITGSNSYFLDAYWMIDAGLGYRTTINSFSLEARAMLHNLQDNGYYQEVAHIPMPGRHYSISLIFEIER